MHGRISPFFWIKQQLGLILLAFAIVVAAYLIARSNRYEFRTQYVFDRWSGTLAPLEFPKADPSYGRY